MRAFACVVVVGLAILVTAGALRAAGDPPGWAYAIRTGTTGRAGRGTSGATSPARPRSTNAPRQHAEFSACQHS